ncbi:hypothetical protein YW7DRAFT_05801 [Streptomyces sp. AmelKG-E11A]|nr:hypothetical protein YW7DRAFT_05801 [Streptomyces sp. AmelKG-E11A]
MGWATGASPSVTAGAR